MLKTGILDNAGKATTRALGTLGFPQVSNVRIGRTIELDCDPNDIDRIAQAQTNAVMEDYTIEEITKQPIGEK
jgi:phosphoribosylformylglycinamidine synthase